MQPMEILADEEVDLVNLLVAAVDRLLQYWSVAAGGKKAIDLLELDINSPANFSHGIQELLTVFPDFKR